MEYFGTVEFYGSISVIEKKPRNYNKFIEAVSANYPGGFFNHVTIEYKLL